MCKYFSTHCIFVEKCCYKHVSTKPQNENTELVAKVTYLGECIKLMSSQIVNLEKEICSFNQNYTSTPVFKCDECGYNASSETVLKRYMTTKHNIKPLRK